MPRDVSATGCAGSATGTARPALADACPGASHPLQRLGGAGQAAHQLERGQRDQGEGGQQDSFDATGVDRLDAHDQSAPAWPSRSTGS